jgi:hypothetical protein
MANIERAIKAALAKTGLVFSLKDDTLYLGRCKGVIIIII